MEPCNPENHVLNRQRYISKNTFSMNVPTISPTVTIAASTLERPSAFSSNMTNVSAKKKTARRERKRSSCSSDGGEVKDRLHSSSGENEEGD